MRRMLLVLAAVGCAESASSTARPPTNAPGAVVDARASWDAGDDAPDGGSLIAGGSSDGGSAPLDRPAPDGAAPRMDAAPDAARDAAPDVVRDAASDGAPEASALRDAAADVWPTAEACGDGVDDNGDGRVDEGCPATRCPVPPAARTEAWWFDASAPPAFLRAAAARGLTVRAGPVDLAALPAASVLVLRPAGPYSDAQAEAIRAWVEGGGALMTLVVGSGAVDSNECDAPNGLVRPFGLAYSCAAPVPWGPITGFLPHVVTDGLAVEDVPYVNGRGVVARPGVESAALAQIDGQVVARVGTPGCGRVLVWGDEHVGHASYAERPLRFWEQALAWLAAPR